MPVCLIGGNAWRVVFARLWRANFRAWVFVGGRAALAFAASFPVAWAWLSATPPRPELGHQWFLFFGVLWSALVLGVLHGPGWLRRPFAHPVLRLVGVVSFSAYLWHMPILDFAIRHGARGMLAGWGGLALALEIGSANV